MSSILKGIVNEGEDLAVIYIDGKPSVKYADNQEAIADVKRLRQKFPNKTVEIKYEVREDDDLEELDENLRKWFKEKWVRFGPDGKIRGACARGSSKEGKPKCLPQSKAHSLGKKGRKYAAAKKRREDPNPERRGKAKNVATKKKTNEGIPFNQCPECGNEIVHESMMNEKQDACYHKVKARYKVWPSAYASGALVQCRKKGAANWGNKTKKNENNIMKGLVDEGVIVGHDANDPDVAIIGGAGTYKLSNVKKKAQMEANELAKDVMDGKFKNSAINVKQLANTLNTIVAAEDEMKKGYFGEDYTGEFAAEKTPEVNPYGGQKDRQFRGAIAEALLSEMPTDNPTGASGEGGWRKYSPKPAGEIDEDTAYAGGMGQGGYAGQSYRKFKPKSAGTFKEDELDEACWKGYHKEGMKTMFGKKYPNCVKNTNEEQLDEISDETLLKYAEKASDARLHKKLPTKKVDNRYAGVSKALSKVSNEEQLDEKCWDTHKQVGMKNKGGRQVPNCVPKESAIMKGLTGKRR